MEGAELLIAIVPGFFVFFAALWLSITWLLSRLGWNRIAEGRRLPAVVPPDAEHYSGQTVSFGDGIFFPINYSHCMNGWVHHSGLFLRPIWMFRLFHPLLLIRWDEFERVEAAAPVLTKRTKAKVRGYSRTLVFYGKLAQAVFEAWSARRGRAAGLASR